MAAARQSYQEEDVAAALRTTYPDNLFHAAKQTGTYHVEDAEPVSEEDLPSDENAFEVYLAEAGYALEDEVEEQDAVADLEAVKGWNQPDEAGQRIRSTQCQCGQGLQEARKSRPLLPMQTGWTFQSKLS